MAKTNFTVFYSWQSDIKVNRNIIKNCIEKAIKQIKQETKAKIALEINIDRATDNVSGSPNIANTIFQKIRKCDIFIGDVTIINSNLLNKLFNYRLTPNPNVMVELGLAVEIVGWKRIICINNSKYSTIEDLPFDIRGHRIASFDNTKTNYKKELTSLIKIAIKSVIDNYDAIIKEGRKDSNRQHDLEIFYKLNDICSESRLKESLSACTGLYTNKYYLDIWRDLEMFYELSINRFINDELDVLMKDFIKKVDSLHYEVVSSFHDVHRKDKRYLELLSQQSHKGLSSEEEFEFKWIQMRRPRKEPLIGENWKEADERIYRLIDTLYEHEEKVISSYGSLILKVKQLLL